MNDDNTLYSQIQALQKQIAELQESLFLYRSVIDLLPLGVQVFDCNGLSHTINPCQKELLGLPNLETGIGQFNVLTDPYAVATGSGKIYEKAYKGEPHEHDFEYNLGLDENKWDTRKEARIFHEIISPVVSKTGQVKYVVALLNDITAEREAEQALKDSQKRWMFAVEGNKDGLWDWDIVTNQVFFSPQWKRMLGYEENEIADQLSEWDKRVHPDDKKAVYEAIEKHLTGETDMYESEHRVLCKDMTYKWILDRGKIISLTDQGKPARMIGTHSDITQRKKTEEALIKSEQRLKEAQETAHIGHWEFDLENNHMEWSDEVYRIVGIKSGEVVPSYRLFLNYTHPDDRQAVIAAYENSLRNKTCFDIIHRLLLNDGAIKYVNEKCHTTYNSRGNPIFSIGTVADITPLISREKLIERQNLELRELNATKDRLFSIIGHDLRNPFNAVLGFADLALEKINNKNYDELDQYCTLIHKSTLQSVDLLNNLLEWSRIQTGSLRFKPETIPFASLLSNVLKLLEANMNEKGITISVTIEPELQVFADCFMLETILRNLISNAIKYSYPNGNITITANQNPEHIRISVHDCGVGIEEGNLSRLFAIEASITTPGTNHEKGSGLGLMICKQFIEAHGGTIQAQSEDGKGTTFSFSLPTVH